MDTEVDYSGISRRIIADIINALLLGILIYFLIGMNNYYDPPEVINEDTYETASKIVGFIVIFVAFDVFMLVKFGGTPGHLLLGMHVKDKNTFKNITVMQAVKRCLSFTIILYFIGLLSDISAWFLILKILIYIFLLLRAVEDECKQAFHDKIANTVVINYGSSDIEQESDSVS